MTVKSTRDYLSIAAVLILIAIVILIDLVDDWLAAGSLLHLSLEIFAIGLTLASLTWIWTRILREMQDRIEISHQRLKELENEAARWREQVASVKPNLEEALNRQFATWKLTEAEQEISRLILKGLSNREISEIRSSSEKTIKQQTTSIYRKTGLSSRSQLAAFFLEDLF